MREQYVRYMCRYVDCSRLPEPGKIVLRGKELWNHPHVRLVWRWFIEEYEPSDKPIALILPCTPKKPYNATPIRRIIYANMKRCGLEDLVQVYTASDPMGFVPREIEDLYPFANYEHPPELLNDPEIMERFVNLLATELPKICNHKLIIVFGSKRYVDIIREAFNKCESCTNATIEFVSYSRLAFRDAKNLVSALQLYLREV